MYESSINSQNRMFFKSSNIVITLSELHMNTIIKNICLATICLQVSTLIHKNVTCYTKRRKLLS